MSTTDTETTTPLADAYVAAHAAAVEAQAAYDAADAASVDDACDASIDADEARDAARAAWLASNEIREWVYFGESTDGYRDGGHRHVPSDVKAALTAWTEGGEWGSRDRLIVVHDNASAIDPATGEEIESTTICVEVEIQPDEPDCTEDEHEWESPYEIVGGCKENPGVRGHGAGIISREVCAHCGCYRVTDTYAQDRTTGQQGYTEVAYEDADDASREWVAGRFDDEMIEACPYEITRHNKLGPGKYRIAVGVDANDDDACGEVIEEIKDAIGAGWSVEWTGNGNGAASDISIERK